MKMNLLLSVLGVGLYLLAGIIFWGNHAYALPLFLGLMALGSVFVVKHKQPQRLRSHLLALYMPVMVLISIASVLTQSYNVGLGYLLLTPLIGLATYYGMLTRQRWLSRLVVMYLLVVGFFFFQIFEQNGFFPEAGGFLEYLQVFQK